MRRVRTSKVIKPRGVQAESPNDRTSLDVGRRVLDIEARAVQALVERLDGGFWEAVDVLDHCKGNAVVSGIGKSGWVGQNSAATIASAGTPAFCLVSTAGPDGALRMLARRRVH